MILELENKFARYFIGDCAYIFNTIMALEGEKYRDFKDRSTIRFVKKNNAYFIKKHFGVSFFEIVKNLFFLRLPITNAKPEWRAIKKLRDLNIPTMEPVGFGLKGISPLTQKSFIITKELTNTVGLKDICDGWAKQSPAFALKRDITITLAGIIRKMHINGINHRDLYICHFLVDTNFLRENKIKLYVIDLHRAQIRRQVPERWLIKDLAGIYFSSLTYNANKTDVFRFLRIYFDDNIKNIFAKHKNLLNKIARRARRMYNKECLNNELCGKKC